MNARASAASAVPTASDYLAAGLKLVAIPRGSKAPKDDGWQLEQNCIRTIEQADRLNGCNIGIAHLWSGTCAVDADDYLAATTWLAKRGIALDDHLAADDAVQISSGRPNRCKLWYRLPDGIIWLPTLNLRASHGIGLELRCAAKDGSATVTDVLPPSVHPDTGRPYEWKGNWRNPPELPEEILTLWRELAKNGTKSAAGRSKDGPIPEGDRNNFLASLAGSMRRRDMSEAAIYAALSVENQEWCDPPLPDGDVRRIAKSVSRYAPEAAREEPPIGGEPPLSGNGAETTRTEPPGKTETAPDKRIFHDTDFANARRLAKLHGADLRFTPERGWIAWSGARWVPDDQGLVMELAKDAAKSVFDEIRDADEAAQGELFKWARRSQSIERARAMLALTQSEPGIPARWTNFDANPWEVHFVNGTLLSYRNITSHCDPTSAGI